jgi:hypothetical protein
MKCLTVRQPWAWLIIEGSKDIENRSWATKYRGPLLIHAGQHIDKEDAEYYKQESAELGLSWPDPLPTGCIIGMVDLVDVVTEHESQWFDGPYGWVLANPRYYVEPLPYKGRLGLYDVPDELLGED